MVSDFCPEERQNSHDNVFTGLLVGTEEPSLVAGYLAAHDFSPHTRRAIRNDLRKFVRWFNAANREPFTGATGHAAGRDRFSESPASGPTTSRCQCQSSLGLAAALLRLAGTKRSRRHEPCQASERTSPAAAIAKRLGSGRSAPAAAGD